MSTQQPASMRPLGDGWHFVGFCQAGMAWQNSRGVAAISSTVWVNDKDEPRLHWEWLVSFSMAGKRRLTIAEMTKAVADWGVQEFEEDNHEPGIARKYWLAIDPQFRKPCPCKDETIIVEGDYQYSVQSNDLSNGRTS
ncbi:MAG: hypothetical protein V7727_13345 [Sneathiella sp.]